jgi:hypothetical protein
MALQFQINGDTFNSLPESIQDHYTKNENGYCLQVDAESSEAVAGLKSALQKERDERKQFQSRVSELNEAMQSVTTELETLRKRDHENDLRRVVAGSIPATIRPEAVSDILHYANSELQQNEDSSFTTKDGLSLEEWMKSLLDKKPHFYKQSVSAGVPGGGGLRERPRDGSVESVISDTFNTK